MHKYHGKYDTLYDYKFSVANVYYTGDTYIPYEIGKPANIRYWQVFPSISMVDSECITMGWNTSNNP